MPLLASSSTPTTIAYGPSARQSCRVEAPAQPGTGRRGDRSLTDPGSPVLEVDVRCGSDAHQGGHHVRVDAAERDVDRAVLGVVADVVDGDRVHDRRGRDLGVEVERTGRAGNVARVVQRPNQHHVVTVGTNRVGVDRPAVARTKVAATSALASIGGPVSRIDIRCRSDLNSGRDNICITPLR